MTFIQKALRVSIYIYIIYIYIYIHVYKDILHIYIYNSHIVHHNPCLNLFILHHNKLFDNQGSEINKSDILLCLSQKVTAYPYIHTDRHTHIHTIH